MNSSWSWPCAALAGADLAGRTTIQVGGKAEWLLEPATPEELRLAITSAREFLAARRPGERAEREPRILGGGANLIVADGVLEAVVIATDRMQRAFRPGRGVPSEESLRGLEPDARIAPEPKGEDARLVAWAGVSMPRIVSMSQKLGWTGFEGLVGVPGNLGGGIAMNAGGRWGEMWDVVERVLLVDEHGELVERSREESSPSYRNGNLGRCIAASAVLRFRPDDPARVVERCRDYLSQKKRAQPVTEKSAGCIWKNPDREKSGGRSAGQLVEACGGKGRSRGDAMVSPLHGNFVLNRGKATAAEVLALIEEVQDLVAQETGIELEREVKVWGA
jgi:UDP-N-acetylenolpyruvoylglucosamine reductase